jgi:hypothetical protein
VTLVRRLQIACVLVAGSSLTLAFITNGRGPGSGVFLALSLAWWVGERRTWPGVALLGMAVFVLVAAVGVLSGINPLWMLATTAVVLAAWDLAGLDGRLGHEKQDQLIQVILKRHLRKLALVVTVGILAGACATLLQARLSFWVVVGLSLLLAFSLSRALLLLR